MNAATTRANIHTEKKEQNERIQRGALYKGTKKQMHVYVCMCVCAFDVMTTEHTEAVPLIALEARAEPTSATTKQTKHEKYKVRTRTSDRERERKEQNSYNAISQPDRIGDKSCLRELTIKRRQEQQYTHNK